MVGFFWFFMNQKMILGGVSVLVLILIGGIYYFNMANTQTQKSEHTRVLLETTQGKIVVELYPEQKITSGNFENLVRKGVYNGVIFHRVIQGFMVQGGDPTGTGYGDKTIAQIKDEFNGEQKNVRGTLSMANAGPNTGSSQFFINLANNNFLDGKHPAFGRVVEGMEVVDAIAKMKTDAGDRPLTEVKIVKASVLS